MMKPTISIVGCGRVGTSLAVFLSQKGYVLAGLASKSRRSAEKTSGAAGCGRVFDSPLEAARAGEILFITTPDNTIAGVCEDIVSNGNAGKMTTIFHCSGALSSEILSPGAEQGYSTGSIHPLQSFAPYEEGGASPFEGINVSVEGGGDAVELGKAIVKDLGARVFTIPTRAKTLYHAAAVVASNYLVTLEHFALELLGCADLDEKRAYEILEPLIQGTLANIKARGAQSALTGPVARGDAEIVGRHMADLARVRPEYSELYRILGRHTLELAEKSSSLDDASVRKLERLFNRE